MRPLARSLSILFALYICSLCAQAQPAQKQGTGVITGQIVVGGKPAPGVVVAALPAEFGPDRRELARATTDYDGNYRLMGLAVGRYSVTPLAPTMVGQSDNALMGSGRFVIVGEAETVEKIDFTLMRAGVITGRITDADGKPVIEERVQLTPADKTSAGRAAGFSNPLMYQTDDRGVYRLYGIPPGRYTLSVGVAPDDGMVRVGMVGRSYYSRTYYPGETDSKKAVVLEVTEGSELKDIDIKLGRPSQAFSISGRVADAQTGRPVSNLIIGYGNYNPNDKRLTSFGFGQSRTDAQGQFRLEGVVPGRFAAFVWSEGETYSDPAPFEVTDADVSGLELKVRRGATITGIAQLEGTSDKGVLARLQRLAIGASVQTRNLAPPDNRRATINPDGSFRLTGLPPGKVSLFLYGYPQPRDIRLVRVERDGVAIQPGGMEIAPEAEITGVRVIFEYGSGSIRGQVRFENGTLPEGTRTFIVISRANDEPNTRPVAYSQLDARGRFIIEGLAAGDYQITVSVQRPPGLNQRPITVKQSVTISSGIETEAVIVMDLSEKATEGKEQ